MREDPIVARRERARLERFAVRQEAGARSEYRVASHTGYSYRVVLRSLSERVNSCDCPDFQSNLLGTCKHIEAILLRLRDRRQRTLRWKPPAKGRAEIYLEYGPEVQIRATGTAATLLRPWFEGGALPAARIERFPELLVRLRALDGEVTVRPDVLDFVTREIERREALREEGRLLSRLDRLKLHLKLPLYPFQKRGALFAALRERTILADDMGLGKTAQAIGAGGMRRRPGAVHRSRMLGREEVDIAGEIERIVEDAVDGVTRVVGLGELVFFSAPGGSAFVLDAEDNLACCLMHDHRRCRTPLVAEDQAGFAIAWEGEFEIGQGCFWTISRNGARVAHAGFPVGEIERFVRAAKGRRA